ncbi:hypothetical protein M3Y97_00998400 [Aphelenchoides bicaudatus]|nr:hypothetical protein M3Y97_00998400 [Aphelenchoides bicaudatus]
MFQNDTKEKNTNIIEINDFDVNLVGEFVRYLHTGKLNNLKENAMEMFKIADYYGVCGLRTICLDVVSKQLNSANAVECFKFASNFNLPDLRGKSLNILKSGIDQDNLINCYTTSKEHECLELEESVVRFLELNMEEFSGFDEWKEMNEEMRLKLMETTVRKCKDNEQDGNVNENLQRANLQELSFHPGYCDSYYTFNKCYKV